MTNVQLRKFYDYVYIIQTNKMQLLYTNVLIYVFYMFWTWGFIFRNASV